MARSIRAMAAARSATGEPTVVSFGYISSGSLVPPTADGPQLTRHVQALLERDSQGTDREFHPTDDDGIRPGAGQQLRNRGFDG